MMPGFTVSSNLMEVERGRGGGRGEEEEREGETVFGM